MSLRRTILLLGGLVLLAGIAISLAGSDLLGPGDGPAGGTTDDAKRDGGPDAGGGEDTSGDADDPARQGDPQDATSARRGPEGSRSFAEVPAELPAAMVSDDASGLETTVSRRGEDWSVAMLYRSQLPPDELERLVDDAIGGQGYQRRRATLDDDRKVIVYDGDDGSILTITLTDHTSETSVGASLISP